MKKNIIAMAVAAAVAAPAAAIADTTLYGKIHASYDVWGGDTAENSDYSLASNSSRIGVKGKEAISDNLALIYQWETGIDFGGNGDGIGDKVRNTFVGFTGGWGTVIAGRHDTPMKRVSRKYDLFGDTVGDSRAILRGGANSQSVGFDERMNNVVAYMTPNMGGFDATIAYISNWSGDAASNTSTNGSPDTKNGTPVGSINNEFDAFSARAGYEMGGFMIDAAYEIHNAQTTTVGLTDDESAYRIGAGYKMGGFKVVGLWQSISDFGFDDGNDVDFYGMGAAYSFGKSTIKGQYYVADDADIGDFSRDSAADLWAVGYDYKMSKQTNVYAAYGSMTSENGSYELAKGTGHGERAAFTGEDSNAFSVGVVHKF
ncbi:porin [Guyparkeria halopsychrophila]|uniref:porin n=1 Tax=Guyparkeria halopsychrophila TaxID=3139421 RepID=UPI0037C7C1D1